MFLWAFLFCVSSLRSISSSSYSEGKRYSTLRSTANLEPSLYRTNLRLLRFLCCWNNTRRRCRRPETRWLHCLAFLMISLRAKIMDLGSFAEEDPSVTLTILAKFIIIITVRDLNIFFCFVENWVVLRPTGRVGRWLKKRISENGHY